MARRPNQIPARPPLGKSAVKTASYVGSDEHKVERWWGGLPRAHADATGRASRPGKRKTTICPLVSDADRVRATAWVQKALAAGTFTYTEADKVYPKHIWHRADDGSCWMGFCINTILGQYKGWPVEESELP